MCVCVCVCLCVCGIVGPLDALSLLTAQKLHLIASAYTLGPYTVRVYYTLFTNPRRNSL